MSIIHFIYAWALRVKGASSRVKNKYQHSIEHGRKPIIHSNSYLQLSISVRNYSLGVGFSRDSQNVKKKLVI